MSKNYARYINFGKGLNNNIQNPLDSSNPLTYCMFPTLNSQFFHGSASGGFLYGNQNPSCLSFMADRCEKEWDGYCQAYMALNNDTYWPNSAVIDSTAYTFAKNYLNFKPTIGQDLLRNACYRKFIFIPGQVVNYNQFDSTVANSPFIKQYDNLVPVFSHVKNLNDPKIIDNDIHVQKMIQYPQICLDVLGRIYLSYINNDKNINIKNSILEKYFINNQKFYNEFIKQAIKFIPSFNKNNDVYIYWS